MKTPLLLLVLLSAIVGVELAQACPFTRNRVLQARQTVCRPILHGRHACCLIKPRFMLVPSKVVLFDGTSFDAFCQENGDASLPVGWTLESDGAMHFKKSARPNASLYTKKEFKNFILHWEWKISPKGNSGVKYHLTKFGNAWLGPEYQMLDNDGHSNGKNPKTRASALYELLPTLCEAANPVGEYNQSMIVVRGTHVQHWLNGKLTVEYEVGSDRWNKAIAQSKFKAVKGFGLNQAGKLYFQDHNDEVWFKNIWLEDLDNMVWVRTR